MVIVRIIGGLGNQIFQYSLISALENAGIAVKGDFSDFGKEGLTRHNGYELERIFNIRIKAATPREINRVKNNKSISYYLRRINNIVFSKPLPHFREGKFPIELLYEEKYFWKDKNIYLDGYWQSESFFKEIEDQLKNALKFPVLENEKNIITADEMKNRNSVSLHIRGGDYISTPELYNLYGCVCDERYYNESIEYIRENTNNPHFYIFSNDFSWVNENIKLDASDRTLIDWNTGIDSFRDMQLMSLCKHQILANSSFSWWSSYLNENKGITISPSKWTSKDDQQDIFLTDWIRL